MSEAMGSDAKVVEDRRKLGKTRESEGKRFGAVLGPDVLGSGTSEDWAMPSADLAD